MSLTHRTQVLLDDQRIDLLRRRAADTGRSVGALIREAIDDAFAGEEERVRIESARREEALAGFLDAAPMPVDDWPVIAREIEDSYERRRS